MGVRISSSSLFRLGVVPSALALVTLSLIAQDKPPAAEAPRWSYITIYKIKPEMRSQFEAAQKEISAAYKQAGVPFRGVWQTRFGDMNEYVSASPLANFAALDGPNPVVKALGEDGSRALLQRAGATWSEATRVGGVDRADLSVGEMGAPPKFAVIMVMNVAPGRGADYETWMKNDFVPALKKGGGRLFCQQAIFGAGGPNTYVCAAPIDNMAAIDAGPPMWKSLGRAGADKMMTKMAGMMTSMQYSISQFRADLSNMPGPPATTSSK
jgi:hypothetical protein